MPEEGPDLFADARKFGEETNGLLAAVLPHAPAIEVVRYEQRFVIRPQGERGQGEVSVPLFLKGEHVASLDISIWCRADSTGRFLAVDSSRFGLKSERDRTPVIRFEYGRDMHSVPHAHIQVHAHRGALSELLTIAKHDSPHDMSALHIPVGGSRFRPCLEDLLQFLIEECGFDRLDDWRTHVEEGRERWRRKQVKAVVRDIHTEAAWVLKDMGYQVEPPDELPEESPKALRAW